MAFGEWPAWVDLVSVIKWEDWIVSDTRAQKAGEAQQLDGMRCQRIVQQVGIIMGYRTMEGGGN